MVVNLPLTGTRWDQPRDGGVDPQALQGSVGAGPGGLPTSMGAYARQAGEAVLVVSEARQSSRRLDTARRQRPAFPEISQTSVGGHATKEVANVLAGAARQTGLRTDGRLRLNYAPPSIALTWPVSDSTFLARSNAFTDLRSFRLVRSSWCRCEVRSPLTFFPLFGGYLP